MYCNVSVPHPVTENEDFPAMCSSQTEGANLYFRFRGRANIVNRSIVVGSQNTMMASELHHVTSMFFFLHGLKLRSTFWLLGPISKIEVPLHQLLYPNVEMVGSNHFSEIPMENRC